MYAQLCFPFFINKAFTYYVPKELESQVISGCVVKVKFRAKVCKGIVVSLSQTKTFQGRINQILSIDANNTIPKELWDTIKWMSKYYITPIGKITQTTLSWIFNTNQRQAKQIKTIQLNTDIYSLQYYRREINQFTSNEQLLINNLLAQYPAAITLIDLKSQIKSTK